MFGEARSLLWLAPLLDVAANVGNNLAFPTVVVLILHRFFCVLTFAAGFPKRFEMIPPGKQLVFVHLWLGTLTRNAYRSLIEFVQSSDLITFPIVILQFQSRHDLSPTHEIVGRS